MDTQKSPRPAASIKSRSRCTWSVAERTEWLRLLDASGQTLSEFCRTNDLPESTVSLWRRQQREASQATTEASEFVEVALPTAPVSNAADSEAMSPAVVIRLPGERVVEVAAGTDVAWLSTLLDTLQGPRS